MAAPERGHAHRQARARAIEAMREGDRCCRCGYPMYRAQRLDLDHNDQHPDTYNGLAHAHCNRSAGATKGNRMRGLYRRPNGHRWQSRTW